LNCNGVAPALYTGTDVGFSSLCTSQDLTYQFVDDVIKELALLTPGPYIHIGGDESSATAPGDYVKFVERVEAIVQSEGKGVIGWEEIANGTLPPATLVQHWNTQGDLAQKAVGQGAKVIMSPANKAYLDMKYDSSTKLGLSWAGYIEVNDAYDWDPANYVSGVSESNIAGIEAPLWSETLVTLDDIEYMAFPRVLGYAEIGWSPENGRSWDKYKLRLAAHGPRLTALGIKFYPSALVPWQ
jgi:hexosaminidase